MSAVSTDVKKHHKGHSVHCWDQKVPTPAYLIALAAGDLDYRDISERVRIWSEPSVVSKAAFDFSGTEDFVRAAEHYTCPYQWGRYDVLCMPPSFPYGGMENPCLTFVTPTLLTGDKSLADVIMHEIAHSWTGNLVTNQTWNHFFLNEGWTMWLQRKIEKRVKGGEDYFKLSAQAGWSHLKDDIALFGEDNPLTCLVCPLGDQDPDDSFSSVPYEKGFTMLYHLETLIGSSNFERFAKHYIDTFKFKTVTSGTFKDCFIKWCNDQKLPQGIMKAVKEIDWDDLFHSPGMPNIQHDFRNSLSDASKSLAESWIQAVDSIDSSNFTADDLKGWNTQQKLIFLDELLEYVDETGKPLSETVLLAMDRAYGFTEVKNAEIRFKWQNLCIKSEVAWILPSAKELLLSQGRMKFTRPLYRLLAASKMGATLAHETFAQNSSIYHPICRKMVKSDLEKAAGRRGWVGATLGPVKLTPNMFTNVAATLGMFLLGQLK